MYGSHNDNYEASFYIFKDGERGVVAGLLAKNLYSNIELLFTQISKDHGINIIHGSVTPAHARLIRMYSKNLDVNYEPTICEGREMVWLTLKLK